MRELFVWYRVDDGNAEAARGAVEAMQRSLERSIPGLQARLLIRRGTGQQTWMETFARRPRAPDDAGIDAATESAIAAAAGSLAPLLASERHVEAFEVQSARR